MIENTIIPEGHIDYEFMSNKDMCEKDNHEENFKIQNISTGDADDCVEMDFATEGQYNSEGNNISEENDDVNENSEDTNYNHVSVTVVEIIPEENLFSQFNEDVNKKFVKLSKRNILKINRNHIGNHNMQEAKNNYDLNVKSKLKEKEFKKGKNIKRYSRYSKNSTILNTTSLCNHMNCLNLDYSLYS